MPNVMKDSVRPEALMRKTLHTETIAFLSVLIKNHTGFVLGNDKAYLLEARLAPVMTRYGLPHMDALAERVRTSGDEVLITAIIEAMTINETSFFRDVKPFYQLKEQVIPELLASSKPSADKTIRILSAACSTGQEPYSIAMSILQDPRLRHYQCHITAIDIAQHVLDKAVAGCYSSFEAERGLSEDMLLQYFSRDARGWHISEQVKSMVTFHKANLLGDMAAIGSEFDIIFCRNVLIYFDQATKMSVLARLRAMMKPKGFLFLGATESALGASRLFKPVTQLTGLHRACAG